MSPARRAWFRQVWFEQPGLRRGYLVDVATALLMGTLMIAGGRARTAAAAWDTLNDNGGPVLWGAVLLGLAVALVVATFWRPVAVGVALVLLAFFYWLIGLWFFRSSLPVETGASFVGTILVIRAGVMHLSRAWAYRERSELSGTACESCGHVKAAALAPKAQDPG